MTGSVPHGVSILPDVAAAGPPTALRGAVFRAVAGRVGVRKAPGAAGYYPRFVRTVLTALATFEKTIVAKESRFDRYQQGDKSALTEEEQRGFETFSGVGRCSRCHKGSELSDQKFHNTGVETDDLGRIEIVRNTEFQLRPYPFFANHKAFKTPSLRNVSATAPYFHNGSQPVPRAHIRLNR